MRKIDKMKCKDCKYWEIGDIPGLHTCVQPKANIGYRWRPEDMREDGIWLENDEGWAWYTGPEFGCVNWESCVCTEEKE